MRDALIIAAAVLLSAGCTTAQAPGADDCMCTMEFRTVGVEVVDAAGAAVAGLDVTVTNTRTGRHLDVTQDAAGPQAPGRYVVVTDANVDDVGEQGDELLFRAVGQGRTAEGTFVIGRDACACHVDRRSGPERLVAR